MLSACVFAHLTRSAPTLQGCMCTASPPVTGPWLTYPAASLATSTTRSGFKPHAGWGCTPENVAAHQRPLLRWQVTSLTILLQVAKVCEDISNDPELQNGYNAVGFSQGGPMVPRADYRTIKTCCRTSCTSVCLSS